MKKLLLSLTLLVMASIQAINGTDETITLGGVRAAGSGAATGTFAPYPSPLHVHSRLITLSRYNSESIDKVARKLLSDDLATREAALREVLSGDLRNENAVVLDELRGSLTTLDRAGLFAVLNPMASELHILQNQFRSRDEAATLRTAIHDAEAAYLQERFNYYLTDALGDNSDER